MRLAFLLPPVILLASTGCRPREADTEMGCGIAALAGATLLLDRFSVPGQTLSEPPIDPPPLLPVRVTAGPAFRGRVDLVDSGWSVTLQDDPGPIGSGGLPNFGVLVVGQDGRARGVLLFSGPPVRGAPRLGTVRTGERELPLLGLQTDVTDLENPACPFFPDSLRRP